MTGKTKFRFQNLFCRFAVFCITGLMYATQSIASTALRTVDYYINHQSIEPLYQNHDMDPTVILHVREVVLRGRERTVAKGNKVLLLVHGYSTPAKVAFDLDHPQGSMMRSLATMGWDVFALDIEGHGESTRAPSLEYPSLYPNATAPVRIDVSVENVNRAVDFIRDLRGVEKVNLLGWSHGAMAEVPAMASSYPEKLEKIVLMGTSWRGWPASEEKNRESWAKRDRLKFKTVAAATAAKRWEKAGTTTGQLMPGIMDAYIEAALQSDPRAGEFGGKVRAPGGRAVYSTAETPNFDATQIKIPTLVLRGELDTIANAEDNEALLDALSSQHKRLVTIPDTGHFYHWEKTSAQTYNAIVEFLEENFN